MPVRGALAAVAVLFSDAVCWWVALLVQVKEGEPLETPRVAGKGVALRVVVVGVVLGREQKKHLRLPRPLPLIGSDRLAPVVACDPESLAVGD